MPEDVDEAELDAELEALGEEAEFDAGIGMATGVGETPGFMLDEVPTFVDEPPEAGKVKEAAG